MTGSWPFGDDADRNDPLTALRIAVASPWAQWCYIVTFDRESPARPTDTEALMMQSFLNEYIDRWYNGSYKNKLAQRLLDVDGGANGVSFRKYADGDWGYRRRTWNIGPSFVPQAPAIRANWPTEAPVGPLTLGQLMDRIHGDGDHKPMKRWTDWKAQHPEAFPQ